VVVRHKHPANGTEILEKNINRKGLTPLPTTPFDAPPLSLGLLMACD